MNTNNDLIARKRWLNGWLNSRPSHSQPKGITAKKKLLQSTAPTQTEDCSDMVELRFYPNWQDHITSTRRDVMLVTWQHGEAASISYVYMVPSWCQLPSQRDLHLMQTILWTPSKQSTQMAYRCINRPVGNNETAQLKTLELFSLSGPGSCHVVYSPQQHQ